ncbi:FAD-dependent oxidoreductase [Curtanaerobium respiraculi]|uniref:FAD-dependent oxidoreductase n=1 Tax=Curtanaerobium respiraculi TaxID=2949669 RepID=UPI0024B32FB9|nr:FAD-binding protein [Curtanaerobium respiraculi]
MTSQVSRRGFLKGAGVAALGAMAATGLAGCGKGKPATAASTAEMTNLRTSSLQTPSWLGTAPEVAESDITETLEYEVVVVGCGTGGIPAIISAAENGAKVLGIDQQSNPGANMREDIGAYNSRLQQEGAVEHPDCVIDIDKALDDFVRYSNGTADRRLLNVWAEESGAMLDWVTDICEREGKFKMWWEAGVGDTNLPERAWATSHSPQKLDKEAPKFGAYLAQYAQEKGAEFLMDTSMVKLEQDERGRVTGVICRSDADKHYIRVNASKGVILSTGGYAANTQMLETRQPWNQDIRINNGKGGGNSGDGIKAALWAGAGAMDPVGTSVLFNRSAVRPDEFPGSDVNGEWWWFGEQPFLKLNLNGERFVNEALPYDFVLHAATMQPHHVYVDVFDSDYYEQCRSFDEHGCCRLFPWDNGAPMNRHIDTMAPEFEKLIEKGYLIKADTMEDLAKQLGLPVDATVASWKKYNEYAEAGHDADFNKEPQRLLPLNHPPFYGIRTGCWFLATIDGIRINTDMQPLDAEGKAIEGLYMTGNDSGGLFNFTYPSLFVGFACGRTFTFGRRAGRLAATREV